MTAAVMTHVVSDFIWAGDRFDPPLDLARASDPVEILRGLWGQFAIHAQTAAGEHLLARDRLGVNKLFFSRARDGGIVSSNFWIDLVRQGCAPASIWSVPAGRLLRIAPHERTLTLERHAALVFNDAGDDAIDMHAATIRRRLDQTFARLRPAVSGRPLYVTLSGGLDSSSIAALARQHLGLFTAVTFVVDGGVGVESDDLRYARRVAHDLDVPLMVVRVNEESLLTHVDTVLAYGQDWRDFNVHCGVVNLAIARALRAVHGDGERPVVLTGDTMNELMADYSPVEYQGREYYGLPSLPPGRLRRFLVQGLDTGDREVGLFAHEQIDVIQPYALCADAFSAVPSGWLSDPDAKQRLMQRSLGGLVPSYIYQRRKVRAQVGSERSQRGVLGVFAGRGPDAASLKARFAALVSLEPAALAGMMRAGVYRYPERFETLEGS